MSEVLYRIVMFIVGRRPGPPVAALGILFSWLCVVPAHGQDTVQVLDEVQVTTQRTPTTTRTAAPTQVLDAAAIEQQGALLLSDAVKQMAGVTLKDYGGVGGMKTISARGLGSQFSTITIDGIAVDNAQNGQVDLGRYLLGNAAYVSFSQGQQQEPLLSARAYAAGNVLNLETSKPVFYGRSRTNLKAGMELGSFGLMSPTALWEQKWSRRLQSSVWVNWLKSDGDYPFTLYHSYNHEGLASHERRQHSAMHMLSADANLFYTPGPGNLLTAKVHLMSGMHQLPGQVILNSSSVSAQSSHEHELFAQARWTLTRGRWSAQVLGKVLTGYDRYEDSAMLGYRDNYLEHHYIQQKGYLSGSATYSALEWLELSGAVDGDLSRLENNQEYRYDVLRRNLTAVAAVRAHRRGWELRTHLLATDVADRVADLDTTPSYRRLSPYAALMWSANENLTLRYFYKETYRAPAFSELYFFLSNPRNLRPERARQHNIGLSYVNHWLLATVDAYFNQVHDKIIAKPSSYMYYWTMDNLGLVHILGVDLTANIQLSSVNCQFNYSFAHAIDLSDPTDAATYGYQIRYTPRHSGGGSLRWENRWVNLGASAMVVGHRYAYVNEDNLMPAYCDIGLSADRNFSLEHGAVRVQVQVLNLFDVQYEVVRYYPMMGRNYRLSILYEF